MVRFLADIVTLTVGGVLSGLIPRLSLNRRR
jgi:hypothetical protein